MKLRVLLLVLIVLVFLTMTVACNDWDGMDRDSGEYRAIQTSQAQGLPLSTPISESRE